MCSTKTLGRISASLALAALLVYSLRGAGGRGSELSILMEPDGTGVWRSIIQQFEAAHPGTRIQLIEGPPSTNTREDMYSTSFLSGAAGYDIVYSDVIWTPKFAAAGWLLDLTDRLKPEDAADFLSADLRAGYYRGRLYRLPAFSDAGVLYYRKDLIPHPPETFGELQLLAREFQSEDRWGFLWQGKQYEGLVTVYLEALWGFGGDWIDAETRETKLDQPEALLALEFLRQTIGAISPPAVTTYVEEDTRNLFQNERAVFLRNWPYAWRLMKDTALRKEDRVGMAPVVHAPDYRGASTLGGWGFSISRFTRNPDMAWQFVEFVTQPEQLTKVQSNVGRIPARKSLVPPEFRPILTSARMRPPIPEYPVASDILQRWLSAALTGRVSPAKALENAARETRLLLGK